MNRRQGAAAVVALAVLATGGMASAKFIKVFHDLAKDVKKDAGKLEKDAKKDLHVKPSHVFSDEETRRLGHDIDAGFAHDVQGAEHEFAKAEATVKGWLDDAYTAALAALVKQAFADDRQHIEAMAGRWRAIQEDPDGRAALKRIAARIAARRVDADMAKDLQWVSDRLGGHAATAQGGAAATGAPSRATSDKTARDNLTVENRSGSSQPYRPTYVPSDANCPGDEYQTYAIQISLTGGTAVAEDYAGGVAWKPCDPSSAKLFASVGGAVGLVADYSSAQSFSFGKSNLDQFPGPGLGWVVGAQYILGFSLGGQYNIDGIDKKDLLRVGRKPMWTFGTAVGMGVDFAFAAGNTWFLKSVGNK